MNRSGTRLTPAFLLGLLLFAAGTQLAAQEPAPGPISPPPERKVIRIPVEKAPETPPLPPGEIIKRFTQKEEELVQARAGYTFRKTIRMQEFGEDGKVSGEFSMTTEPAVGSDGRRYEKVLEQLPSTLRRMRLEPEDLETLARVPPFVLTGEQLLKHELTYQGKQQVDELNTYVFRVKPRRLERTRAYFEGLIWVDDRDLLVVKTYGKWVTETGDVTGAAVPFTIFETYRELTDGKYWFPVYSRSDDYLPQKNGELHLRLIIRWTDYKAVTASPTAQPAAAPTPARPPGK